MDDVLLLLIESFNDVPLYKFLALLSVRTLHAQVQAHGEDLDQGLL